MWDIADIKRKKEKILKEIKDCNDIQKKEMLEMTLASYISMIDNCGTIKNTKFYNFLDKITKGNFSLIRPSTKYISNAGQIIIRNKDYMDIHYLSFLLDIMNNIIATPSIVSDIELSSFNSISLSNEDLLNLSKLFYKELADEDIYIKALKTINNKNATNFSNIYSNSYSEVMGITFYDFLNNEAFCTTKRNYTIFDAQACNHEIMHSVDFYFKPKLVNETYYGFHEIPTYAIDYLFIEYLEKIGFDKDEVQKLRIKKDNYLRSLALRTKYMIQNEIIQKKGLNFLKKYSSRDVLDILNPFIIKQLTELESGIIAYGLHKQFDINYNIGINNLKKLMTTSIPKDRKPDFSNLELPDKKLIELSYEIGSYSMQNEENVKYQK